MSDKVRDIRSKFATYMEFVESFSISDEDIQKSVEVLMEVGAEIEAVLEDEITPELVHLVVDDVYPYMGKLVMEKQLSLLRKYMDMVPDDVERFWAHDGIVYTYLFLRGIEKLLKNKYVFTAGLSSTCRINMCWMPFLI